MYIGIYIGFTQNTFALSKTLNEVHLGSIGLLHFAIEWQAHTMCSTEIMAELRLRLRVDWSVVYMPEMGSC
jgi:hypothetical protein